MFFCFLNQNIDICKYIKISTVDNHLKISEEVGVGNVRIGGKNPVLIQSMTDVSTSDMHQTIEQCIRIFEAGAGLVRIATPAIRDAKFLKEIRMALNEKGFTGPLAADIHYSANIAEMAAAYVEKVRINPGNYIDKRDFAEETGDSWQKEIGKIRNRLQSLVQICKRYQRTIRVGVNHGSLSERILQRYGDTPEGMVESVMEFLRILNDLDFHSIVVSLKSSNPLVMVQANRLLKEKMLTEGLNYPFHIGVTEAGEGIEGRIRSAMGIGSLLWEGIGDTIRVSLTEAPENEIPVAKYIINYFEKILDEKANRVYLNEFIFDDSLQLSRIRKQMQKLSGHRFPFLLKPANQPGTLQNSLFLIDESPKTLECLPFQEIKNADVESFPVKPDQYSLVRFAIGDDSDSLISFLQKTANIGLLVVASDSLKTPKIADLIRKIRNEGLSCPIAVEAEYAGLSLTDFVLELSLDLAPFLISKYPILQGFYIRNSDFSREQIAHIVSDLFQVSRHKISRTEFISCPGCGRTLFNLQEKTRMVKDAFGHLSGLKIAVMGCMVNGPGEMADSDFGFVGAGGGRVSLYAGKELVKKNIPEGEAINELFLLIKNKGYL